MHTDVLCLITQFLRDVPEVAQLGYPQPLLVGRECSSVPCRKRRSGLSAARAFPCTGSAGWTEVVVNHYCQGPVPSAHLVLHRSLLPSDSSFARRDRASERRPSIDLPRCGTTAGQCHRDTGICTIRMSARAKKHASTQIDQSPTTARLTLKTGSRSPE